MTVHHSFVRLPCPGFTPRRFDIRSGAHATQVYDFATPLGEPVLVQLANHFRLDKVDPAQLRQNVVVWAATLAILANSDDSELP